MVIGRIVSGSDQLDREADCHSAHPRLDDVKPLAVWFWVGGMLLERPFRLLTERMRNNDDTDHFYGQRAD